MFNVIATAAQGMAIQGPRVEAAAAAIASVGSAATGASGSQVPAQPTRVGALPADDIATNVVTLIEAQTVYRANAAVLCAAAGMLDTLLDIIAAGR